MGPHGPSTSLGAALSFVEGPRVVCAVGWDCQEEDPGGGELVEQVGDLGERHLAVIVVIEVAWTHRSLQR